MYIHMSVRTKFVASQIVFRLLAKTFRWTNSVIHSQLREFIALLFKSFQLRIVSRTVLLCLAMVAAAATVAAAKRSKTDASVLAPISKPAPKSAPVAPVKLPSAALSSTSQTTVSATADPDTQQPAPQTLAAASAAALPSSPKAQPFRPNKRAQEPDSPAHTTRNKLAAPKALVFSPRSVSKEKQPVHLTARCFSRSGALISKHMKSGGKVLVLFVNHNGYPRVVYRMRQSLIDFLSKKGKDDANYPATLSALQEQGILFQMNDANPDYGEPYQSAFFLGVPTHAALDDELSLGNGLAFLFEWLHYKTRQQDFGQHTPAVVLHNLSEEPDAFFLPHLARFQHTVDAENPMALTVASLQSSYWKIPFRLVLSLTKERLVVGIMGPGTWNARVDLEALSFVMQAHDRVDDEALDYDVERKCHIHPVTGDVVTEKIYKYLAEMREGLLKNLMQATCQTAMLLDVTVEEGADVSTIKGLIDEIGENPWVVRNS